jgi:hypothetical protein
VAKARDSSSIEQLNHKAAQLDDENKRLQRSLVFKESLLRDTKARLDVHEEGHVQWAETTRPATTSGIHPPEPNTGGLDGMTNLPVAELRNRYGICVVEMLDVTFLHFDHRLKASELERNRARARVQALKERVTELETESRTLHEEIERLKRINERSEALRASLTRRDQQLSAVKTQLETTHRELTEAKQSEYAGRNESQKTVS